MRKINIMGKDYTLRFDMAVMEKMEDAFGGFEYGLKMLDDKNHRIDGVMKILRYEIEAGCRYMGQDVPDLSVLDRMSPAKFKKIFTAVRQALLDGMQLKDEDEDDEVRDVYMEELQAEEREKNSHAGT